MVVRVRMRWSKGVGEVKEIRRVEVVIKEKCRTPFCARLSSQMGICCITKLWYKIDRNMAMIKRDNSTHRGPVGAGSFLQYVHASDRVGDGSLTARHAELGYDVKTMDICKIEGEARLQLPNGAEDEPDLSYKKT